MADVRTTLWAPQAWLVRHGVPAWHASVTLVVGSDGTFESVNAGAPPAADMERLAGPVIPGLVDAHSHAFQRAFAGLAERGGGHADDFWSWRDRMYSVALRVEPAELGAIAARLYTELLAGGYTQVCEFHYLHRRVDGHRYDDPLAMTRALADAASEAGIGLTVLPALYERAGFAHPALREDQRRFASSVEDVLRTRDAVRALPHANVGAGVAVHSLRAATPPSIARLVAAITDDGGPIHVHASEQRREVDECVASTGLRPIEWLAEHAPLDARWQLVHATHATSGEIASVAQSGAGIVLCPTTEANLGDGTTDVPGWLDAGVPISLGSDSNVARCWWEEVRMLEYGQRLALERRNVLARAGNASASTAETVLGRALAGGGRAAGFARWGLERAARADLVVLDAADTALLGIPEANAIDALVFSSSSTPVRDVMVAGRWAVRGGRHLRREPIDAAFTSAMRSLWGA